MDERITTINGTELLKTAAEFGLMAAIALSAIGELSASSGPVEATSASDGNKPAVKANPLKPPVQGSIPVAFLVSEGAVIIPAQSEPSAAMLEWIRKSTKNTDVTMSVCTGAFVLAKTGLLSGKTATTFHAAFRPFAMQFPDIHLKRGARFVEDGNLATAGGLSSGIDLALRVVERYYGRDIARKTAYDMEYQGQGWRNADSNQVYANAPVSTAEHPLCPVCGMDVNPATAPKSVFKGKTYYFCSQGDKDQFDATPNKFATPDKL